MLRFFCTLAVLLCVAARARAEPCTDARVLLDDVARLVASEEADGWFSDAEALRDLDEPVLESTCHASPEARAYALEMARHARNQAGDPRELFRAQGELTGAVERALTLERQRLVLERTVARAATECPFWLRPDAPFEGLQTDRHRLTLSVETSGNVQLRQTEGEWTIGGGGIGRLLPGYGLDGRYTLLAGLEFGGGAMIRPNTSASQFVINYFPAIPVVFRTRQLTWHYDLEVAPVGLFQADDTHVSFGFRAGAALGFDTIRRRNTLPWAGLAVAYEHYFRSGDRAPAHFIRGGLRVGLPWDP